MRRSWTFPATHALGIPILVLSIMQSAALADCPPDPAVQRAATGPYSGVFDRRVSGPNPEVDPDGGRNPSIALAKNGVVVIGYERPDDVPTNSGSSVVVHRFNANIISGPFTAPCIYDPGDDSPLRLDDDPNDGTIYSHVSLAIAREGNSDEDLAGDLFASWLSKPPGQTPSLTKLPFAYDIRVNPFPIDTFFFSRAQFGPAPASTGGNDDAGPSAGIGPTVETAAIGSRLRAPASARRGLVREAQSVMLTTEDRYRCCDDSGTCSGAPLENCTSQYKRWTPCVASRKSDGLTCVVWAERENPNAIASFFNIALRIYDESGNLLAQTDRDSPMITSVNQPDREPLDRDQLSPAVAFDDCGNIIVVWVGPPPRGAVDPEACQAPDGELKVYARRLAWNAATASLEFKSDQFIVNTDPAWKVGPDPDAVNPTVALHEIDGTPFGGRFAVAWNAVRTVEAATQVGVRGQLYYPNGEQRGDEFDVTPNVFDGVERRLAESAQHTLVYWTKDEFLAAWTAKDPAATPQEHVWFSVFASSFGLDWTTQTGACLKGDADGGGFVDLADIQPFIDFLLADTVVCAAYDRTACAVDTNYDGQTNGLDVQCFTNILVPGGTSCTEAHFAQSCLSSGGEGEEGGAGQSQGMVAPQGQTAPKGMTAPAAAGEDGNTPPAPTPPSDPEPTPAVEETEDPVFAARWNTFVDWFNAHQPEAHPEMTEEAWDAWVTDVMMETLYGDESP